MSDLPESALPPTARRDMEPSSELDVGECFAPFIPQVAVAPAPRRKPKPAVSVFEKVLGELGYGTTSTDAGPKTGLSVPEAAGNDDDTDLSTARPNEILTASVETPLPIPRKATVARNLHVDQAQCLGADAPAGRCRRACRFLGDFDLVPGRTYRSSMLANHGSGL